MRLWKNSQFAIIRLSHLKSVLRYIIFLSFFWGGGEVGVVLWYGTSHAQIPTLFPMSNIPLVRLVQLLAWLKQGRKRSILSSPDLTSSSQSLLRLRVHLGRMPGGSLLTLPTGSGLYPTNLTHAYLVQRISMAIQQGNAAAVMGTAAASWEKDLNYFLY